MLINEPVVEGKIKSAVIENVKLYKGKGPLYVKINIANDIINIDTKEVMSNIEKILIRKNEVNELNVLWEKIRDIVLEHLISNIYKETKLKCEIISSSTDYIENHRKIVLKICN